MTDHTKTRYNFARSISMPFRMPGGGGFLLRLLIWSTLLTILVMFLFGGKVLSGYFEMFQNIMALEQSGDPEDPAAVMAAMAPMFASMSWIMLLWLGSWVIKIATETAMHKNIIRGTDHGIFPLRFGADEGRVWVAQLVVGAIGYGAYMVGYFIILFLILIAALTAQGSSGVGVVVSIIAGVLVFAVIAAIVFVIIRFAPAAAMSVRDDEIRTLEGWKATQGRTGALFGSYFVVGLVGYIILSVVVIGGFMLSLGDFSMFESITADPDTDPDAFFTQLADVFKQSSVFIPLLVVSGFGIFLSMLWYMCLWGIPNYAAELDQIDNHNPETVFE